MNLRRSVVVGITVLGVCFGGAALKADDRAPESVTVSFGRGLNTAQPGNAVNHHILPQRIRVAQNGVVNFVVAGFHWVYIYKIGTQPGDLVVPAGGLFVNDPAAADPANLFYKSIRPAQNPAQATTFPTLNQMNRTESVSFPDVGTYLVICNIRGHFLDGMFAFIKVVAPDDDN